MTCAHCLKNNVLQPSHKSEITRLNKISGQIEGVKKMIEDNRYCPDIIVQIKATRAALKAVENNILKRHLNNCVKNALENEDKETKIQELIKMLDSFSD